MGERHRVLVQHPDPVQRLLVLRLQNPQAIHQQRVWCRVWEWWFTTIGKCQLNTNEAPSHHQTCVRLHTFGCTHDARGFRCFATDDPWASTKSACAPAARRSVSSVIRHSPMNSSAAYLAVRQSHGSQPVVTLHMRVKVCEVGGSRERVGTAGGGNDCRARAGLVEVSVVHPHMQRRALVPAAPSIPRNCELTVNKECGCGSQEPLLLHRLHHLARVRWLAGAAGMQSAQLQVTSIQRAAVGHLQRCWYEMVASGQSGLTVSLATSLQYTMLLWPFISHEMVRNESKRCSLRAQKVSER